MKTFFKNPLMIIFIASLMLFSCKNSNEGDGVSIVDTTEGNLNSLDGLVLDFDEVGISTTYKKSISFYNKGSLNISNFTIDSTSLKDTPFTIAKNNCPSTIDVNTRCTIEFSFNSTEIDIFNAEVSLNYLSGIDQRQKILSLHAIAGTAATLEFDKDLSSPFAQELIEPNATRQLEYRIKNIGGLSARNVSLGSLPAPFSYNGGDCTARLYPQSSCTIRILYAPTVETLTSSRPESDLSGEASTDLTINYFNAIKTASLFNTIIGKVDWIEGRLKFITNTSYDYKSKLITTSTTQTFKIKNYGFGRATNLNFSIPNHFSIVSNNCSNGIDADSSCDVVIAFTPNAVSSVIGDLNGEVSVNFESGRGPKSGANVLKLVGTGLAKASFMLDPLVDPDYGVIAVGDDKTQIFTIKNIGGFAASNLLVSVSGDASLIQNGCYSLVGVSTGCPVTVNFSPTAIGARFASINISYYDGISVVTQNFALQANGIAAAVIKKISNLNFGNTAIGTTGTLKLVFKNVGIVPASSITLGPLGEGYDYVGGVFPGTVSSGVEAPCTDSLDALASCQVNLIFSPVLTKDYTSSVKMDYFNLNLSTQLNPDIYLNGHGASLANLIFVDDNLSPIANPYNFGSKMAPGTSSFIKLKLQNNGEMPATAIQAEFLSDTAHVNFAFDSSDTSKLFPGVDESGNAASACTSLQPGQSCSVYVWFNPSALGTFSDKLVVDYNNFTINTSSQLDITGIGAAIGIMNAQGVDLITNNFALSPAAIPGGNSTTTLTLTNSGNGNATFSPSVVNMLGTTITRNTCAVVAAGASCEVDFKFAPTSEGLQIGNVTFNYSDGTKPVALLVNLSAMAYPPIEVSITPAAGTPLTYDFDLVEVGSTKTQQFSIVNTSLGLSIASLNLTNPSAPYSMENSDCVAPLGPGQICHVDIKFSPTSTGTFTGNLVFNFNNGVISTAKSTLKLTGKGETPTSTHNGWSKIYAIGIKEVLNKTSVNDKKITFGWFAMTPKTGTITKYNIYRSTTSNGYNFTTTPYASTVSASVREYTDTNITAGTVYYYTVRPVVTGFTSPSRTTQSFSELMVVAPPNNMAFLHRWAVNREVCGRLGFNLDSSQDFSCNYSGPGNINSRFDFGTNMLIDRFELGANYKSISGQKPAVNLTQTTAQSACATQNFTVNGRTATFVKRILTRKEFAAASLWPSTMTNADIVTVESGTSSTVNCNASGFTEATGTNTNCVSTFGLENMAGNEWEWVSDRVLNGVGITDDTLRIDANNKDLDNIDIGYTLTGSMFSQECFSIPMSLPFSKDSGVCQGTRTTTGLGESYFHNNTFFSPGTNGLKGPVAGGSSYTAGTSGIFTTYWTNVNNYFGTRCGVAVP